LSVDNVSNDDLVIESTDIVVIAGKRRSGKTTLAKGITSSIESEFLKNGVKIVTIDPLMELNGIYIRFGDRVTSNKILSECFKTKNIFLRIDEADGFFPNRVTLSKYENEFIHIGRHWGLGGMFMTRRLARLHTDLVSQANKIFIFKLWNKADLDYLRGSDLGDFIPIVTQLKPYHFLGIDLDNNKYTVYNPI